MSTLGIYSMALPKRQNPEDEDFGSNHEECIKVYYEDFLVCTSYACSIKVYYEDLFACTSYACLHQLRMF